MNERNNQREIGDALYDVIVKLCVFRDFMQVLENPKFCMSKHTPEGFSMIIGECINTLKEIGGLHEQTTN